MRYYIPDIAKEADAVAVANTTPDANTAQPAKPSFFQRLFGGSSPAPAPTPAPAPSPTPTPRPATEESAPVGQFGGMPATFPQDRWPHCSFCNGALSFIAQFDHDLPALDLGAPGRSLYIFMCDHDPGMCFTWEADKGGNACIVLEPGEKYSGPAYEIDAPQSRGPAMIYRWLKRDDALTSQEAEMVATQSLPSDLSPDERTEIHNKARYITHLGGIPHWIQSASEGDQPGWEFVGQLESGLTFLQDADRKNIDDPAHKETPSPYESDWFNFGGGGAAYLFAERPGGGAPPVFHMFWQCG